VPHGFEGFVLDEKDHDVGALHRLVRTLKVEIFVFRQWSRHNADIGIRHKDIDIRQRLGDEPDNFDCRTFAHVIDICLKGQAQAGNCRRAEPFCFLYDLPGDVMRSMIVDLACRADQP
jgi:hypothetical protein